HKGTPPPRTVSSFQIRDDSLAPLPRRRTGRVFSLPQVPRLHARGTQPLHTLPRPAARLAEHTVQNISVRARGTRSQRITQSRHRREASRTRSECVTTEVQAQSCLRPASLK